MRFEGGFSQPYELNIDFTGSHYNFNTANKTVEIFVSNHYGNINLPMGAENARLNNPYTSRIFNGVVNVPDSVTNCLRMFHNLGNYNAPHTIGNNVNYCHSMFLKSGMNSRVTFPANGTGEISSCQQMFSESSFNGEIVAEKPYYINSAESMFMSCTEFNKPVTNLYPRNPKYMFAYCTKFNQPVTIPAHETSGNCIGMFDYCYAMNSPVTIGANVTDCAYMFRKCNSFNSAVTIPDSVTNCQDMFRDCIKFNQPISIPDNAINCLNMFYNCYRFNQPVTIPDGVVSCYRMFYQCNDFNQEIRIPNSVINIDGMFVQCSSQNQHIYIPEKFNNSGGSGGVNGWTPQMNELVIFY